MVRRTAVLAVVLGTSQVHAEDPAALVTHGEELARQGEFSQAIQAFKQADTIAPSAANACRIGLVYTRRELWSQAEIFFARCRQRATAADPVPDWLEAAEQTLVQKLVDVEAAEIVVQVDPRNALVWVSSFPPDETFAPQRLHLSPGTYTLGVTATGRLPAHATIIVDSAAKQIVSLVLAEPPPPRPPPPPPPTRAQRIGTAMLYGAGGLLVLGGAFHAVAGYERSQLRSARDANDPVDWDHHDRRFETARLITLTSYGLAVVAGVTGLYLRTKGPERAHLVGAIEHDGATVGLAWNR